MHFNVSCKMFLVFAVVRSGDCSLVFSYTLDPADTASVCSLLHLSDQRRVAVGLSNGRVFLVRSDSSPTSHSMAEGSFVMSELGSSTVLHAIAAVYYNDTARYVMNHLG